MNDRSSARVLGCAVLIVFVAALILGGLHGHGKKLPSVALGWSVLLYVERAAAITAPVLIAGVVILRLLRGELPSKLGRDGLEWPTAVSAITAPDRATSEALVKTVEQLVEAMQANEPRGTNEPSEAGAKDEPDKDETKSTATPDAKTWEIVAHSMEETRSREQIADAIAGLPEREKLVVALYYYEGLSEDVIAEHLGVTRAMVAALRLKATARIRERAGRFPDQGGDVGPV